MNPTIKGQHMKTKSIPLKHRPAAQRGEKSAPTGTPTKALIHDFHSHVFFALPLGLQGVLGDAEFQNCIDALQALDVTSIYRCNGHVVYIHFTLHAQTFDLNEALSPKGKPRTRRKGT
jgi:hypothetical protein